ncbi:hypothetical protein BDK92_7084 [Micromonospora pisi]|uniref:Uncharacterized protein n=1 Tax=Micromonospora pisi TaxID=589240 RepID=A0A495JWB3_9ACTN|nr:hypothetical protein [Micromonospora pisi]RKR92642.1 hypothetical protein BDK92_7084 [Micromonospora pisi]
MINTLDNAGTVRAADRLAIAVQQVYLMTGGRKDTTGCYVLLAEAWRSEADMCPAKATHRVVVDDYRTGMETEGLFYPGETRTGVCGKHAEQVHQAPGFREMTPIADAEPEVPTLSTVDAAITTLRELAETNDWVSVFWDRGWGDDPGRVTEISIIVDGNGQVPKARITPEVYAALLDQQVIPANSLKTFKARRLHDYVAPPVVERDPAENTRAVAEALVLDIMRELADVPILAELYRGLDPNSRTPRIRNEHVRTPAWTPGWHIKILPGFADAAISAWGLRSGYLDLLGDGPARCVAYPITGTGPVDLDALRGPEFRAELIAVIRAKAAEVDAARRPVTSSPEGQ